MHSHPLGHISIGVRNYETAKRFYSATLPLIGLHLVYDSTSTTPATDDGPRTLGFGPDAESELLNVFEYGSKASAPGPGSHIAFNTDSRAVVDQFYEAAVRNGGKSNGAPGVRPHYGRSYYAAIIRSGIYKFVVGPHNKEYSVHGAAISGLSKPLGVLLNGDMREASEKLWNGQMNYLAEEPDIFLDHSLIAITSELINQFLDVSGTVYPTSTTIFSARKNTEGCEDYTGVFLCHAKLYVLGDKYDIPPLKQLSLHRLHATLKEFILYPSRMNDIATLTKYIFENTVPDDKIREMLTLYYACIVEDARKHDGLKSLVDEIPDFAFSLIFKISDRLA
ncbi:hypothetical protein Daus18300_001134 [Diaporthe australafricana]|uniref:VOC domain-containing protein n=1 Tax=Diaporthe australafricana TaxID=127596 RepID=A0ABR3XZ36_9PEZI